MYICEACGTDISIRALREEGDGRGGLLPPARYDFYPRPPRGGRPGTSIPRSSCMIFLSTPSARRATSAGAPADAGPSYFYPRPPRGGRQPLKDDGLVAIIISIHALREEGDQDWDTLAKPCRISIHALREEGDFCFSGGGRLGGKFLSTPSARRATTSE